MTLELGFSRLDVSMTIVGRAEQGCMEQGLAAVAATGNEEEDEKGQQTLTFVDCLSHARYYFQCFTCVSSCHPHSIGQRWYLLWGTGA